MSPVNAFDNRKDFRKDVNLSSDWRRIFFATNRRNTKGRETWTTYYIINATKENKIRN